MSRGIQSGLLCACGCGEETRQYGRRVCRYVRKHFLSSRLGQHAGYIIEDRGFTSPCWIWQGGTQGQGYGRMSVNRRNVPAHRHYYEEKNGPIPPGLTIDHLCRVPSCVNPDHLEPVTLAENLRRGSRTILNVEAVQHIKRVIAEALDNNAGRVPAGLYQELADTYGTRKDTIRAIRKGDNWVDV